MSEASGDNKISELTGQAKSRWQRIQQQHGWVRHLLAAYALTNRNNANQYAAAITYFSFLALFPLLLLAVSIVAFVLAAYPDLQTELFTKVTQNIPGTLGTTLKTSLQTAIDKRSALGVVGLLGVVFAGLGWINNLRQAIDAVWGRRPEKRNFVMSRVANLFVLGGLGLGVLVSVALTTVGTSVTDQLLRLSHLDTVPGSTFVTKILGIAIAVLGDMIIFWWVLIRLPQAKVARKSAIRGVFMAAVGFEILKIVGTYTIAHTTNSPTAGPFASVLAILIWIQLVARWLLFCCSWLATAGTYDVNANQVPLAEPPVMVAEEAREDPAVSPATVGAALVGAGALAGVAAALYATRTKPDD